MDTEYIGDEICRLCQDQKYSVKKIGPMMTYKLKQRLNEIHASGNLAELKRIPGARCHDLIGNRLGQWAVDLKHPKRLIFLPCWENNNDKKMNEVKKITLLEIVDYH